MGHRIGLIGCGGIAGTWIDAVTQHEAGEIAMTFDPDAAAARQRAEETGARVAPGLEDILESSDIDMVILATPNQTHADLVEQAAAAGKHVMCEKPMALNLDECQRMIDACARGQVKLAIGHTLRFWGPFLKARELVQEGVIGTPVSGSIDRMGAGGTRKAGGGSSTGHWREDAGKSGGSLLEGYVHEVDFTRAVFGDAASAVCQIGGGLEYDGLLSPEIVQAVVAFESGAVVTMRTGRTVGVPTGGYWVGGTEGGLRFTNWSGPVELYRGGATDAEQVECESPRAYWRELDDLVKAIETGGEPENDGQNGMKNVGLALAMYRSFETGQRVEFEDGLPQGMGGGYKNTRY